MFQIPFEIVSPDKEQIDKPLVLIIIWRPSKMYKSSYTFIILYIL